MKAPAAQHPTPRRANLCGDSAEDSALIFDEVIPVAILDEIRTRLADDPAEEEISRLLLIYREQVFESVKPDDALQRMLLDQVLVAHFVILRAARWQGCTKGIEAFARLNIEVVRLMNATGRHALAIAALKSAERESGKTKRKKKELCQKERPTASQLPAGAPS